MRNALSKAIQLLVGSDLSIPNIKSTNSRPLKSMTERELIQLESEIGSKLFGPVSPGCRREFFNENPAS